MPENGLELMFNRPLEEVAADISTTWKRHSDRKTVIQGNGEGKIFVLRVGTTNRFYRLEEVIAYTHDYTIERWPKSRGPEIARLKTADVIGYQFHQSVLPFIKVEGFGSAANLQFSHLRELDRFGEPLHGDEDEVSLKPAKLSSSIGLQHRGRAFMTLFNIRGNQALLLATGARQLSPDELQLIEEELLAGEP